MAFVDKTIRGNIIYNLFYQLVVNMGKYLPQKGKGKYLPYDTRYFRGPFPFFGKYLSILTHCLAKVFEDSTCLI